MTGSEMALIKAAMNLGGVFVIFLILLFFAYRICTKAGPKMLEYAGAFISAQEKQAMAMTEMKDAFTGYINKDNNEHREILLGLQVLAREIHDLAIIVKERKAP